jgi:hypothetical protein
MLTAVVLVAAGGACGSETATSEVTGSQVESADVVGSLEVDELDSFAAAEVTAALFEEWFGDEATAMAAVLLAADQGYRYGQLEQAAVDRTLQPDGQIVAVDGSIVAPSGAAQNVLIDDGPVGLVRRQVPVSEVVDGLRQAQMDRGMGPFVFLLMALHEGYAAEQVMEQVIEFVVAFGVHERDSTPQFVLRDTSGNVIEPAGEPTPGEPTPPPTTGGTAPAASTPDSTTTEVEPGSTDSPDARYIELLAQAVGTWEVDAQQFAADLVSSSEIFVAADVPTGLLEVDDEGTISGELVYRVTADNGATGGYDYTFPETDLKLLDDGLTFSTVGTAVGSNDGSAYDTEFTGYLDLELDELLLADVVGDTDVRFVRVANP